MERIDTRPPFAASGGVIPPELRKIKTPCYVLDEAALIKNAELMGNIAKRTGCKMLLAQKAFSNYDCYHLLEPYLTGTEASGLYEARLGAQEMPGKEVHVFCAGYREDEFEELLSFADHIVFNSPSQLLRFGKRVKEAGKSAGLRINPECSTQEGHAIYDPCAPGSRMGTTRAQWETAVRKHPELIGLLDGIHFHTLCEQDSSDLETTLTAVKMAQDKGVLEIEEGTVKSFREKNAADGAPINAGYMVLEPQVFDFLKGDDACIFEKTALVKLAEQGELMSYVHTGFWQCMDNIREKNMLEKLLAEDKAPWKRWDRSVPNLEYRNRMTKGE